MQIDLIVQYWSESEKKVEVNYLDFKFMGHTQAGVLVERMKNSLST